MIKHHSNTIVGSPGFTLFRVYAQFFPSFAGALFTSTNYINIIFTSIFTFKSFSSTAVNL